MDYRRNDDSSIVNYLRNAKQRFGETFSFYANGAENESKSREFLKELYWEFKREDLPENIIFRLLYINLTHSEDSDLNLFSKEIAKVDDLRQAPRCTLINLREFRDRIVFPNERKPFDWTGQATSEPRRLNGTILEKESDDDILNYVEAEDKGFQATARIPLNMFRLVSTEVPVLDYNIPACECTNANNYRCHHCQKIVEKFVSCKTCEICVFCSRECYYFALDLYHRWECFALQRHMFSTNLWLATRLMLIGMQTNIYSESLLDLFAWRKYHKNSSYDVVNGLHLNYMQDKKQKAKLHSQATRAKNKWMDGYYYKSIRKYYQLRHIHVNWKAIDNIDELILDTMRMVAYLAHSTDLCDHLMKCPWKPANVTTFDVQMLAAGMILRHYGEVLCHGIVSPNRIVLGQTLDEVDDGCTFVVAPYVTMFRHSCEPNAVMFLCDGFIFVKLITDVAQDEYITVNYFGIEENFYIDKRKALMANMYFKCDCTRCNCFDDVLGGDSSKCHHCNALLNGEVNTSLEMNCLKCEQSLPSAENAVLKRNIGESLKKESVLNDPIALRLLENKCRSLYRIYNPIFAEIYKRLLMVYIKQHNKQFSHVYFGKYVEVLGYPMSPFSKVVAKNRYDFCKEIYNLCRKSKFYDEKLQSLIISNVSEIKTIFMFYFEPEPLNVLNLFMESMNTLFKEFGKLIGNTDEIKQENSEVEANSISDLIEELILRNRHRTNSIKPESIPLTKIEEQT